MRILSILRCVAVAVLATVALGGCQALLDSRSTMRVEHVLDAFAPQEALPATNPRDVAREECEPVPGCTEAVRTEQIAVFRFDDREDAADFAESLGDDGHQSDWIVLEYPDAAFDTDETLLTYAGLVDGMWTSH